MLQPDSPPQPSLPWRVGSATVMGLVGSISRIFMFGANRTEVHGLDQFLELLDERRDIDGRERGLLTGWPSLQYMFLTNPANPYPRQCRTISACTYVSHTIEPPSDRSVICDCLRGDPCRVDDPMVWGALPFRHQFNPNNHRWSFGSYDICFTNKYVHQFSTFRRTLMALVDSSLPSSPWAKSFPPTAMRTPRTAASSNQLSLKLCAYYPVLHFHDLSLTNQPHPTAPIAPLRLRI